MATDYKLNALLSLPEGFDTTSLKVGEKYTIEKDAMRVMPVGIPMELSTHDHKYLAKVRVLELKIVPEKTYVTFEIIKVFSPEESKVFSDNFMK